jgi:protein-disulfide isomerase
MLVLAILLGSLTLVAVDKRAVLRPPKGAKVAIVVFEDLQCPDCARAAPLVEEAARTYKIPVVRHDFPLPMHNWAFDAAVLARYFESKSKKLGDEFRHDAMKHQVEMTRENLRAFAEKFAAQHNTMLPFVVDPRGEMERKVKADYALGQSIGIQHTPTIYVVSNTTTGAPFVEVVDRSQLFRLVDDMLQQANAATAATPSPRKTRSSSPQ